MLSVLMLLLLGKLQDVCGQVIHAHGIGLLGMLL